MKWIVGTNLREDSAGAFEFVSWLHSHARDAEANPVVALAVVRDGGDFLNVPSGRSLIVKRVEDSAREFVSSGPARDAIKDVRVEVAPSVAERLCETAKNNGATLILGRAAPMENQSLVRLGSVARRTLRRLEGPVVIVPPDWTAAAAAPGPIVVAVDPTPSSLSAITFAEALATAVARPLVAVAAIQGLGGLGTAFLAPAEYTSLRDRHRQQEAERLAAYLEGHGRASLSVRAEVGPTVTTLVNVAEELQAAAIVSGSRRLTLAERLFSASVGTELASFSPIPVAVVPPDFGTTDT